MKDWLRRHGVFHRHGHDEQRGQLQRHGLAAVDDHHAGAEADRHQHRHEQPVQRRA
jgi:hypothetical protein